MLIVSVKKKLMNNKDGLVVHQVELMMSIRIGDTEQCHLAEEQRMAGGSAYSVYPPDREPTAVQVNGSSRVEWACGTVMKNSAQRVACVHGSRLLPRPTCLVVESNASCSKRSFVSIYGVHAYVRTTVEPDSRSFLGASWKNRRGFPLRKTFVRVIVPSGLRCKP